MRKFKENPNRLFLIYAIRNKVNGKVYIGRTNRSLPVRWKEHIKDAFTRNKCYFHNAICKYGPESFKIVRIDRIESAEESFKLEQYYIKMFKSDDSKYGYNSTPGGEGAAVVAETTREKHSKRVRGKNHPLWGKPRSQEVKDRLREFHLANSPVFRRDVVVEEVIAMYAEGMSLRAIGKIFDADQHTIAARLKAAGVSRRVNWNKSYETIKICQSKNWRNNKALSKPE